ncbi:MAG: hypothetical protein O4861_23370 [Trichodesmium sp. St16_bin4-tuft]|nr:hypothetical protein [Trichodesmium sp. St4_bin8_1]MDE5071883.1 hypothetical protein [Trichodesmium sp. St5_bin8]MDE5101111.1 hypothetical protein [Trichodesmium sp. St16_bin4-tuft]MDE5103425.1 hypothetical protein [Trichodesmium sp. St19_bin2]
MFLNPSIHQQIHDLELAMEQLELQKEAIAFAKKIDNEVGKITERLEEIFKQFPDYKNIVSKRLRFGEVTMEEDLSVEDLNDVDAEFNSSEIIEVKEIEKTIETSATDTLQLGDLVENNSNGERLYVLSLDYNHKKRNPYYIVCDENRIFKIKEKNVLFLAQSNDEKIAYVYSCVKNLLLKATDNYNLSLVLNNLTDEIQTSVWKTLTIEEKNHIECVRACPKLLPGTSLREMGVLGSKVLYVGHNENKNKEAYYIGYYLNGEHVAKDKRVVLIDGDFQPTVCDQKYIKPLMKPQPDEFDQVHQEMLIELKSWMEPSIYGFKPLVESDNIVNDKHNQRSPILLKSLEIKMKKWLKFLW